MNTGMKTDKNRTRTVPSHKAVGMILAHDITEIRPGRFKGAAFKKGHVVRKADVPVLKRLGKENLYVLQMKKDEMHEDDVACLLARALSGPGVKPQGEPSEGKVNLVALRDGLFTVDRDSLLNLNMLGEVMCATLHENMPVKKGQVVAGTRAIPLVVKKQVVTQAGRIAKRAGGILSVRTVKKPRAGVVITGNEVYYGSVKDAFEPVITEKIEALGGRVIATHFAPDDTEQIEEKIRGLLSSGVDLVITTGGMSVDPDDVTRFAIRNIGAKDLAYGSPVLPGAMFLVAYVSRNAGDNGSRPARKKTARVPPMGAEKRTETVPILGIPACGMYNSVTVLDLVLPRVLAGERIGRKELAELGCGGLCMKCDVCRYPVCPFGK